MPTYKLTLEYEGTRYSGWQAQGNTQKTIQGHLLRAAGEVLGEVDLGGAGRTDAGVHASGQVAHLRSHQGLDPLQLTHKLNDLLPHDICILDAVRVRDGFHARHDALSRVYLYQIATRRTAFAKPFVWWIKDTLDVKAMQEAALAIAGRHDFSAFTDKRLKEEDSRIVVVERCELARSGDLILVRIAASHFLWKMVRKLISYLVEVGRGNIAPSDLAKRLHAKGEPWAPTAPPSGLFLEAIVYEGEEFVRPLEPLVAVARAEGANKRTTSQPEGPRADRKGPRAEGRGPREARQEERNDRPLAITEKRTASEDSSRPSALGPRPSRSGRLRRRH